MKERNVINNVRDHFPDVKIGCTIPWIVFLLQMEPIQARVPKPVKHIG